MTVRAALDQIERDANLSPAFRFFYVSFAPCAPLCVFLSLLVFLPLSAPPPLSGS